MKWTDFPEFNPLSFWDDDDQTDEKVQSLLFFIVFITLYVVLC